MSIAAFMPSCYPYTKFMVGDLVSKVGGDYTFDGIVVSIFLKRSGAARLVVEDDRGILHIFSEKNLTLREPASPKPSEPNPSSRPS